MIRTMIGIGLATAVAVAGVPAAGAQGAKQEPRPYTQAFLKKAGEMQQAEISLALLVDGRAANDRVRQFADHMIAIHKKLLQEVQELAAEKGVTLPSELSDEHKQKIKEFSQLSGHRFDRTYMHYILRDHQMDVENFEEGMQTLEDSDVLHWTYRTLPILRAHVEEARWIQQSLQTN
jgi:putative membrane protein